jgi:NADH dehydrogenase FAD-containing subunit
MARINLVIAGAGGMGMELMALLQPLLRQRAGDSRIDR